MDTKECRMCGESKPVGIGGEFSKQSKSMSWRADCKACVAANSRAHYERNREKKLEYNREYYQQNREKKLESMRAYREANREVLLEKTREYYEQNREVRNEYDRERNAKRHASWTPTERAANASVRKAVARSNLNTATLFGGATFTEAVAFTLPFTEERLRLEEQTNKPHEIDHIVPIIAGGLHVPENLQVIPRHENRSKGGYWDQADDDLTDEEIEAMEKEALEFTP